MTDGRPGGTATPGSGGADGAGGSTESHGSAAPIRAGARAGGPKAVLGASGDGIRALLTSTLRTRMRARDRDTVAVLRTALAAIDNAEAVPSPSPTRPDAGSGEPAADDPGRSGDVGDVAPFTGGSAHVATPHLGVGAAEVARRDLTEEQMRALVAVEADERAALSRRLGELGSADAARTAAEQAAVLRALLDAASRA
ncbi:hypothetical protein [Agilicoccus flavus]|uniref:hypothetical protein n=1 Tax=Agilicoccus flavus TaxID=2775968 RepID=UPI001CF62FBB|nr:hypothetical protein [Agilicoccus flavus]